MHADTYRSNGANGSDAQDKKVRRYFYYIFTRKPSNTWAGDAIFLGRTISPMRKKDNRFPPSYELYSFYTNSWKRYSTDKSQRILSEIESNWDIRRIAEEQSVVFILSSPNNPE